MKHTSKVYIVKSESNPLQEYTVTNYQKNFWRCSCRNYVFKSVDSEGKKIRINGKAYHCKHIKKLLGEI